MMSNDISNEVKELCQYVLKQGIAQNFFPIGEKANKANQDWGKIYEGKQSNFDHDEPWHTLLALIAIWGDSKDKNPELLNKILNTSKDNRLQFDSIDRIYVEKDLPSIPDYTKYIYDNHKKHGHSYRDRSEEIIKRSHNRKYSLEGSSKIDIYIEGKANGRRTILLIEAKLRSDISSHVTYCDARNQIARNIDSGLHYCLTLNKDSPTDFYFFLLTPKKFKTKEYYADESEYGSCPHCSDRSRLYCYKMNDYRDWRKLKEDLPSRTMDDDTWHKMSSSIGWITFEDIHRIAKDKALNDEELNKYLSIYREEYGYDI
jgi:hypothetical protein